MLLVIVSSRAFNEGQKRHQEAMKSLASQKRKKETPEELSSAKFRKCFDQELSILPA